uniref:Uncharacterized protein n=1 Tax=uncultured marine virus TaxID=186617 RepID=A0A0F7L3E3_9VIRU|nr:hypothetical protein [uncultured marine virus]
MNKEYQEKLDKLTPKKDDSAYFKFQYKGDDTEYLQGYDYNGTEWIDVGVQECKDNMEL